MSQGAGPPSTIGNLKAAAAGIHGVGETLRGTFNSSIDRNVGHASAETLAKNEQVLQSGRNEMDTGRFDHHGKGPHERIPRKQAPSEGGFMNKLRVVNHE